jgi:hypothetical protein
MDPDRSAFFNLEELNSIVELAKPRTQRVE